jgi:phosphoglycerate dehydrogenase-like enzyme
LYQDAGVDDVVVTLPEEGWAEALGALPAGVTTAVWSVDEPAAQVLGEDIAGRIAVVVWPYNRRPGAPGSLGDLPALRLVQTLSAGYDDVLPHVPQGVTLANAAGVHDASTAELAVGLALASLRGIDQAVRDAEQQRWHGERRRSLADRRVLVLGVGGVGGAIIRRLEPFEVSITRVASRARQDEAGVVHGIDELPGLLPEHDVVFIAIPLTETTQGLVDERFLAGMPDGALLVNVGRGPIVVTDDLLAELKSGRLQAAIDVVDPEPLPAGHPLWDAPGLVMTPHVGGNTTAMRPRAVALLREQLKAFAEGAPLRNVIR